MITIIKNIMIAEEVPVGRHLIDKLHPAADIHHLVKELSAYEDPYTIWCERRSDDARIVECIDDGSMNLVI